MAQSSEFNKKLLTALKKEKKPFITMNKLAEYMTSEAIRRRQIISTIKKDNDFTKVYYSELRNIISKYFKSNYDSEIINSCIEKIKLKPSGSDWNKTDNENTIKALKLLRDCNKPNLEDYTISTDLHEIKSIVLSGVTVSIKPELFFKHKKSGKIGALKIHLSKTADNRLDDKNRVYAAVLLKQSLIMLGINEKDIDNNACISLDIFSKEFNTAPASYKRLVGQMEASCEEIALRWDTI